MLLIISPKNVYATKRLQEECAKASIEADFFDIQDLAEHNFKIDLNKYSGLYVRQAYPYFAEVVGLAKQFVAVNKKVIDSNIVEGIGEGKAEIYERLFQAGISIPRTTQFTGNKYAYPYILKWMYGFGGKQVHLVQDETHVKKVLVLLPKNELLAQEFIQAKYEYKVITVGYKSLPIVLRFETQSQSFKPDFSKVKKLDVTQCASVVKLSETSAQLLGRELAKVDILEDFHGNLFVLEVNRWPGLKTFEKFSGLNVVSGFMKYIKMKTG